MSGPPQSSGFGPPRMYPPPPRRPLFLPPPRPFMPPMPPPQHHHHPPPPPPGPSHDYVRGDDGGIRVDLRRVDFLLARRLACKKAGRYDEADSIRAELRQLGVEVQDRLKLWRVVRGQRRRGVIDPSTGHDYKRDHLDQAEVDLPAAHRLIAERLQCKMGGDYVRADEIRQRLRADYGVQVNDRDKVWRVAFAVKRPLVAPDEGDEPNAKRRLLAEED